MILSTAERERKINDFLTRKFKELDIEDDAASARSIRDLRSGHASTA